MQSLQGTVTCVAHKQTIGAQGEDFASSFLETLGYRIIDRNWRGNRCEIDIIALDKHCVVFVEVKTRASSQFGLPIEAVTTTKLAHMHRAAIAWLAQNQIRHRSMRFDVVGIQLDSPSPAITHLIGVGQ